MEDIYEAIVRIKQEGNVAALATIVWVKGSTPRAEGAKMLIRSDGSILGSVGGGCLEADVWQAAMKSLYCVVFHESARAEATMSGASGLLVRAKNTRSRSSSVEVSDAIRS